MRATSKLNDPEEREENAPELPAPPEIKQKDDDEEAEQQEKGCLRESGLELKKLLGKSAGLDESGDKESSDDDNNLDNEDNSSPVLAPKRKEGPKEEPVESTPAKAENAAPGRTTPASTAASEGKRKAGTDDSKQIPATSSKKVKMKSSQEDVKPAKEPAASVSANTKAAASPVKGNGAPNKAKASSQVTEDEVKAVLEQAGPIKTHDLLNKFKNRLATKEDKQAFTAVLKNISRIHRTDAGNFIVLRNNLRATPDRTTPASTAASKGKQKAGTVDSKQSPATSSKKVKTESLQENVKPAKEPAASASANTKAAASPVKGNGAPPKAKASSQVTEDDVKAVLEQAGSIKSHDLVKKFKNRLATKEDKQAFAALLKNISRIHKTDAGDFFVLHEK